MFFTLALLAALLKIGGVADSRVLAFNPPAQTDAVEVTSEQRTETTVTSRESTSYSETSAPAPSAASLRKLRKQEISTSSISKSSSSAAMVSDRSAKIAPTKKAPVFRRPVQTTGKAPSPALGKTICGDLSDVPKGSKAIFPLANTFFNSYEDTWGAARPQGGHEGTDLMAPDGTPEYAITGGTVVPVSGSNGHGWNTLGGYTVMVRSDYDFGPIKAGDIFYYAHMNKPTTLKPGTRVRAGQIIGYAGDTGQGPEITRGLFPSHLHFGWYDTSHDRTSLDSGAMNPFPLLEWLKNNGGAITGGSDAKYCQVPQSGPPIPSTGGDTWTFPTSPGERPDLDTGSDEARPSPVVEKKDASTERAPGAGKSELPKRNIPQVAVSTRKDARATAKKIEKKARRAAEKRVGEAGGAGRGIQAPAGEALTGVANTQPPGNTAAGERISRSDRISPEVRRAVNRRVTHSGGHRIRDIVRGVLDRFSGKPSSERAPVEQEKRKSANPERRGSKDKTNPETTRPERTEKSTNRDDACAPETGGAKTRTNGKDDTRNSGDPCGGESTVGSAPSGRTPEPSEPEDTRKPGGADETGTDRPADTLEEETTPSETPPAESTTPAETTLAPATEEVTTTEEPAQEESIPEVTTQE